MAYPSPEAAVVADVPAGEVRVLDVSLSPDADYAMVLAAFGQSQSEVMESLCVAGADGWEERTTEQSPGWTWLPTFGDNGVVTEWTDAAGFRSVRWNEPPPERPPRGVAGDTTW